MATITLPATPQAASTNWRLVMPTQTNVSGWTGARQTLASGRGWWECTYQLPVIAGKANANPWRSFIAQMRGGANDAQFPIDGVPQEPDIALPTDGAVLVLDFVAREYVSQGGTSTFGAAYVNGASQTGRSLVTAGWPESDTVLSAGEHITINNQLLVLTADVVSDLTGAATISFEPPIRVSPSGADAIEYRRPYALMYFSEPPTESYETGVFYGFSFELREAF